MNNDINTGFISLHRKIMQHWTWSDSDNLKIWLYLLMEANHSGQKIAKGSDIVEIKRGEIYKSLQTIANELRLSKGKIRNTLKLLQKDVMITHKLHTNCTHITITNYDKYQTPTHKKKTSCEQDKNEIKTSCEQVVDVNNNINNVDNVNNGNNDVIKTPSLFTQIKDLYFEFWQKNYQITPVWVYGKNDGQLKNLIKYFAGKTDAEIIAIMKNLFNNWSKLDKFWADKNDIGQLTSNIHKLLMKIDETPQQQQSGAIKQQKTTVNETSNEKAMEVLNYVRNKQNNK